MDDDPLFELAVYLVASARLTLEEPVVYGSFRLVEAAIRTLDARSGDGAPADAFLAEQAAVLRDGKLLMIEEPDVYAVWLDGVVRAFAAEAKSRALAEAGDVRPA